MNSPFAKIVVYILMPLFWLTLLGFFLYSSYADRFLSRHQRLITIFIWSDIINPQIIENFEKETGIKIDGTAAADFSL